MFNPFYFTDRVLKIGLKNPLVSHLINQTNSKLNIKPFFS